MDETTLAQLEKEVLEDREKAQAKRVFQEKVALKVQQAESERLQREIAARMPGRSFSAINRSPVYLWDSSRQCEAKVEFVYFLGLFESPRGDRYRD